MSKLTGSLYNKAKTNKYIPIWFMRQAGRYLPEYQKLRLEAGNFLNLCYNSDFAFEAAMQPLRRFDLDAAILFSDILVVPNALGLNLEFLPNHGPKLQNIDLEFIDNLDNLDINQITQKLTPSYETISKLRAALPSDKSVIGFCGAPWTLAHYMLGGSNKADLLELRLFARRNPVKFKKLIDFLTDVSISYLKEQIKAGADTVQIFDSWAGVLGFDELIEYSVVPVGKIVHELRITYPEVTIIAFPKGANSYLGHFSHYTWVDVLSVDWTVDFNAIPNLRPGVVLQGNLDPTLLVVGGDALENKLKKFLDRFHNHEFIFNLGHGILPETPVENIEKTIKIIRSYYG